MCFPALGLSSLIKTHFESRPDKDAPLEEKEAEKEPKIDNEQGCD
jgi:hypothetical protein